MYVCMYVRNGFTIEIYQYKDLCTVYIFFRHVPLMMPSRWRLRTGTIEDDIRTSLDVLTAQQKDVRLDNGDKKQLASQHPSDLLCSLTCERDRWRTALQASPFCLIFPCAPCEAHDTHVYS